MVGPPREHGRRPRRALTCRGVATVGTALLLVASCSSGSDTPTAEPSATEDPSRPATTAAVAPTTTRSADAASTTAAPPDTTGPGVAEPLPPCMADMGSTLQADLLDAPPPELPGEGRRAPEEDFDWDQDGTGDRLLIGDPDGTVTLDWGTGRLAVTSVHTDFTVPITDEDGFEFVIRGHGPSPAQDLADSNRPAAVGDVTGDGWLDLIVTHRGTAAVLAGAGDQTLTGTISFGRVGLDTPGWRSPPARAPQLTDPDGNPVGTPMLWPMPVGDVRLWSDVDGDGAEGFTVGGTLDRTIAPVVAYAGIPCATRPPPAP